MQPEAGKWLQRAMLSTGHLAPQEQQHWGELAHECASQFLVWDAAAMQVDAGAEADADDSADSPAVGARVPRPKRVPCACRHKELYLQRACVRLRRYHLAPA